MVVVKKDNLPSNEWWLGSIVSAFPGGDDRIGVVEIRTSRGTIKHPVHKVILYRSYRLELFPFPECCLPILPVLLFYWNTKFSELAPRPRAYQSLERRRTRGIQSYRYRVWPELHPLRKSKRFNKLSTEKHHLAVLIQVKWSYPTSSSFRDF